MIISFREISDFFVQTVERILIKKSTLFCLLLFLFCIFTVFSIGCLHGICGFKLIEFSYIVCLEVSILSIVPRIWIQRDWPVVHKNHASVAARRQISQSLASKIKHTKVHVLLMAKEWSISTNTQTGRLIKSFARSHGQHDYFNVHLLTF